MSEPRWLDKSFILNVHDRQLELHGGARGLRDEGCWTALWRGR